MKIEIKDNLNFEIYKDRAIVAFQAHQGKKNWQYRKMETAIGKATIDPASKYVVAEFYPDKPDLIIVRIFD